MIIRTKSLGDLRIRSVKEHSGFFAVDFLGDGEQPLVGIVFPENVAVIDPHFPALVYRSESFEPYLREAVACRESLA